MARYGLDYYGLTHYGSETALLFSAAPVEAYPYAHGVIRVSWSNPQGQWNLLRIVRNSYGYARSPEDGDIVYETPFSATSQFFDTGAVPNNIGLTEGKYYYYSIFVQENDPETNSTVAWRFAGGNYTYSTKNYKNQQILLDHLPSILRVQDTSELTASADNIYLKKFLNVFGFELDRYRTVINNLNHRYDAMTVDAKAIPRLLQQFGHMYEPALGLYRSRTLLKNATYLSKLRGSTLGVHDYVKAYAGYDNDIVLGKNLFLSINDSSFENNVGSWKTAATGVTLSIVKNSEVTAFSLANTDQFYPNKTAASLKVVSASDQDISLVCVGDSPITSGIPVVGGSTYTFSAYSKAQAATKAITTKVSWYTGAGTFIKTDSGSSVTNSSSGWTARPFVSAAAPIGAKYCVPSILITNASGTSGNAQYFDAVQFEKSATPTLFQEARKVIIYVRGNRVNELINPNFELNVNGWTGYNIDNMYSSVLEPGENPGETNVVVSEEAMELYSSSSPVSIVPASGWTAVSAGDTSVTVVDISDFYVGQLLEFNNGSGSKELVIVAEIDTVNNVVEFEGTDGSYIYPGLENSYTSSGRTLLKSSYAVSNIMGVNEFNSYTFSGYVKDPGVIDNQRVVLKIDWYSGSNFNGNAVSEPFTLNGDWNRFHITASAPELTTGAKASFHLLTAVDGEKMYVDAALFERSPSVQSFFDGTYTQGEKTDTRWEGTVGESRSHYYINRKITAVRLNETISDWVTYGTDVSILFDQPGM